MRWIIAAASGALAAAGARADPPPAQVDTDSLYEAGRQLFDQYAPPEVRAEYAFPTPAQWDAFTLRLQKALAGRSLDELVQLEPEARAALAAARLIPGAEDYAGWLQRRLDDIEAADQAAAAARPGLRPPDPFERVILLVEDDPLDAILISRAFKHARLDNPLKVVPDAEEGLEYLFGTGRHARERPARPQLILLDLNLPRMSGLEFLRRIKADERTRDVPVAVLTMSRSDTMIEECSRLGAENYIVKPLDIEGLMKVTPKLNLHWSMHSPCTPAEKAVPA